MGEYFRVIPRWAFHSLFSSVAALSDLVVEIEKQVEEHTRKIRILMSNQETLDTYVSELNTAVGLVASEIQGLKDQLANQTPTEVPVDFSGLDSAVHAVEALEPPVLEEPPVEEPPVEGV